MKITGPKAFKVWWAEEEGGKRTDAPTVPDWPLMFRLIEPNENVKERPSSAVSFEKGRLTRDKGGAMGLKGTIVEGVYAPARGLPPTPPGEVRPGVPADGLIL